MDALTAVTQLRHHVVKDIRSSNVVEKFSRIATALSIFLIDEDRMVQILAADTICMLINEHPELYRESHNLKNLIATCKKLEESTIPQIQICCKRALELRDSEQQDTSQTQKSKTKPLKTIIVALYGVSKVYGKDWKVSLDASSRMQNILIQIPGVQSVTITPTQNKDDLSYNQNNITNNNSSHSDMKSNNNDIEKYKTLTHSISEHSRIDIEAFAVIIMLLKNSPQHFSQVLASIFPIQHKIIEIMPFEATNKAEKKKIPKFSKTFDKDSVEDIHGEVATIDIIQPTVIAAETAERAQISSPNHKTVANEMTSSSAEKDNSNMDDIIPSDHNEKPSACHNGISLSSDRLKNVSHHISADTDTSSHTHDHTKYSDTFTEDLYTTTTQDDETHMNEPKYLDDLHQLEADHGAQKFEKSYAGWLFFNQNSSLFDSDYTKRASVIVKDDDDEMARRLKREKDKKAEERLKKLERPSLFDRFIRFFN